MRIQELSLSMQKLPVIMIQDLYSNNENSYSSNDVTIKYKFKNYKDFEMYKEYVNKLFGYNVIKESNIYYYKTESILFLYLKRQKLYNWKSCLNTLSPSVLEKVDLTLRNDYNYENMSNILERYNTEQAKLKSIKLKSGGFINHIYPLPLDEYKGSLNILYTKELQNYIGDGRTVWGYLGHGFRQHYMDLYLESLVVKLNASSLYYDLGLDIITPISEWLSSRYARHTMDSLEDLNKTEVKQKLKKIVRDIICEAYPNINGLSNGIDRLLNIR